MSEEVQIRLKTTSILTVPLKQYENFSFIVNGKEFKTTRLIAELLSPKICQIHLLDPTIDTFSINTKAKGNFSIFFNLFNFDINTIQKSDIFFISEVNEILGNKSIEVLSELSPPEMTKDNIISLIREYRLCSLFNLNREIEFLSENLNELIESSKKELIQLDYDTIESILKNDKLQIQDEDQLLFFIIDLYKKDVKYSELFEYVLFNNVSSAAMKEFLSVFDLNNINHAIWSSLSNRLQLEVQSGSEVKSSRYKKIFFYEKQPENGKHLDGIINFLKKQKNNNIDEELNISASSSNGSDWPPKNAISYDNPNIEFMSTNSPNSWLCFEFKNHTVIPNYYEIRSYCCGPNNIHPKSWVIEGSNDQLN